MKKWSAKPSVTLITAAVVTSLFTLTLFPISTMQARFTSNASGSDGARVAKFGNCEVSFEREIVQFGTLTGNLHKRQFVFTAEFTATYNVGEVSTEYELYLKFADMGQMDYDTATHTDNRIGFGALDETLYQYDENGDNNMSSTSVANLTGQTFTEGYMYYAIDGAWSTNESKELIDAFTMEAGAPSTKKTYKILYFVDMTGTDAEADGSIDFPSVNILCKIVSEQVD